MASGLADYNRVIRQTFGGAVGTTGTKKVVKYSLNELVSVSGKGMIYGSFIDLAPAQTQANSEVVLLIDDKTIIAMSFNKLNAMNLSTPRCFPIVLLQFDNVSFNYVAGIAYGLTFETCIKLLYYENHGRTPSVSYTFIYTLV